MFDLLGGLFSNSYVDDDGNQLVWMSWRTKKQSAILDETSINVNIVYAVRYKLLISTNQLSLP